MIQVVENRPRILIVEDELIVASDIASSLKRLGYEVLGIADTGKEAMRLAAETTPDLVLMDVLLPGSMDGIAAAEEIRRRWQIPVVFVTANTNQETLSRARVTGPYGYLIKPIREEELNATVLVALNQHRLARELFAEHTWLRTMLASLSDGIIATDADGCVRYMNPAGERLTGCTLADAEGKSIEEVYALTCMDSAPVERRQLRKALESARPSPAERFLLHRPGAGAIPIEDSAAPVVEGGRAIGAVTVFRDITERLRQERDDEAAREDLEERLHLSTTALGQTRAELRALSDHLMNKQEEERSRIARELHDDLGQRTALLELDLERLRDKLKDATHHVEAELRSIGKHVREVFDGLRSVSHRLHPSLIADLGIEASLRSLVEEHRQHTPEVSISVRDVPSEVPLQVATALYRIAQEALRNALKHAPGAPVRVKLASIDGELHLSVDDAGPGFQLDDVRQRGGLGLLSMQERARLAGGTLSIRARSDLGTSVLVRVPITREASQ